MSKYGGWLLRHIPTACPDGFAEKVSDTLVRLPLSLFFSLGLTPPSPVSHSLPHSHQLQTLIPRLFPQCAQRVAAAEGAHAGAWAGRQDTWAPDLLLPHFPGALGLALIYLFTIHSSISLYFPYLLRVAGGWQPVRYIRPNDTTTCSRSSETTTA